LSSGKRGGGTIQEEEQVAVRDDNLIDIAIIGAGPYGLSLSSHLRDKGIEHVVFGRPMESWRDRMPKGMYLKSEGFASNIADPGGRLTLRRFSAEHGRSYGDIGVPVPLEDFCDYGEWFRREADVPVDEAMVDRVSRRAAGGFTLDLADGRALGAQRVVLAPGQTYFAHVPPELALPSDVLLHSSAVNDPSRFEGRSVSIVGGGSSALELAALLHEAGADVTVYSRSLPTFAKPPARPGERPLRERLRGPIAELCAGWDCWGYSRGQAVFRRLPTARRRHIVDTKFGPQGGWWLRNRVDGIIDVRSAAHIDGAEPFGSGARLVVREPGTTRKVVTDTVVAATGYRPDVDSLAFLAEDLRRGIRRIGRYPVLSPGFETSVAGIYVLGVLAGYEFGPSMRFVAGTRFAARRAAAGLAERQATASR
jgi:thioredoxin reductase